MLRCIHARVRMWVVEVESMAMVCCFWMCMHAVEVHSLAAIHVGGGGWQKRTAVFFRWWHACVLRNTAAQHRGTHAVAFHGGITRGCIACGCTTVAHDRNCACGGQGMQCCIHAGVRMGLVEVKNTAMVCCFGCACMLWTCTARLPQIEVCMRLLFMEALHGAALHGVAPTLKLEAQHNS